VKTTISSYKDGQRLHDSEFVPIAFHGDIDVSIGDSTRDLIDDFGRVAQICLFKGEIDEEIDEVLMYEGKSSDCAFSSYAVAMAEQTLVASLQHESLIRKLMIGFLEIRDEKLLAVLTQVIRFSKDKSLPWLVKERLTDPPQKYFWLFEKLISEIEDNETQKVWFEEILLNGNMWGWKSPRVLKYWKSVCIVKFEKFFGKKSYFQYFLMHFDDLVPDSVLFLKRVALRSLDIDGVSALFSKLFEYPQQSLFYLELIRDLADLVLRLKFNNSSCLFGFIGNDDPKIVILAIECLYLLGRNEFFHRIIEICHLVHATEELLRELEASLDRMPGLFSLTCALALFNRNLQISTTPRAMPEGSAWWFFPLLLYVTCDEPPRNALAQWLVEKVIKAPQHFGVVLELASLFAHISKPSDVDLVDLLLHFLLTQATDELADELIFQILVAFCFHIGPESHNRILVDLSSEGLPILETPSKVVDGIDSLKAFLGTDFASFKKQFRIRIDDATGTQLADRSLLSAAQELFERTEVKEPLRTHWSIITKFSFPRPSPRTINDFTAMSDHIEQVQKQVCLRIQDALRVLKQLSTALFKGISIAKPGLVPAVPLTSEPVRHKVEIARSHFLTSFVPFGIERIKQSPRSNVQSDAQIICHGVKLPVKITFESKQLRLSLETDLVKTIDLADITHLIRLRDEAVEIIANRISTVLLTPANSLLSKLPDRQLVMFADRQLAKVTDMQLPKIPLPQFPHLTFDARSPDRILPLLTDAMKKWLDHQLSSFKYLTLINVLSGRSFGHPDHQPVFPSIEADFDKCPSRFGDKLDNVLLVSAEHYFFPGRCGAIEVIYENRKKLENCPDLHIWISRVFGREDLGHRRLFGGPHEVRKFVIPEYGKTGQVKISDGPIVYVAATTKDEFIFVLPTRVLFVELNLEGNKPKASTSKILSFDSATTPTIFQHGGNVMLGHNKGWTIVNQKERAVTVLADRDIIGLSDGICQTSGFDLMAFAVDGGRIEFARVATLTERIVCFAASKKFNITAVGCNDCKLRIRSITTGSKIATVELDNEVPVTVLITKAWGFVLVRTERSIFIFTLNGIRFNKFSAIVKNWFTFSTGEGADYVAIVGQGGELNYFDIADPGRLISLDRSREEIRGFVYNRDFDCFLVFVESGMVFIVARPG
jgi:hypothetical protein